MSLQRSRSKLQVMLCAAALASSTICFGAPEAKVAGKERTQVKSYEKILDRERKIYRHERVIEDAAGGIAALAIGIYGYFNDNHGAVAKVIYGASEGVGVYMIGNSLGRLATGSMLLGIDDAWRSNGGDLSYDEYRNQVGKFEAQSAHTENRLGAAQSGALAVLYFYNGYRERTYRGISNIFYVLGFNFALLSTTNLYKVAIAPDSLVWHGRNSSYRVAVQTFPLPSLSIDF
jgi:hypothetical protein